MVLSKRILFILIILILISISGVSATNFTDSDSLGFDDSSPEVICEVNESQSDPIDDNVNESKEVPTISVDSLEVYEASSIGISLKDSNNAPISNQNLTANINDETCTFFRTRSCCCSFCCICCTFLFITFCSHNALLFLYK